MAKVFFIGTTYCREKCLYDFADKIRYFFIGRRWLFVLPVAQGILLVRFYFKLVSLQTGRKLEPNCAWPLAFKIIFCNHSTWDTSRAMKKVILSVFHLIQATCTLDSLVTKFVLTSTRRSLRPSSSETQFHESISTQGCVCVARDTVTNTRKQQRQ